MNRFWRNRSGRHIGSGYFYTYINRSEDMLWSGEKLRNRFRVWNKFQIPLKEGLLWGKIVGRKFGNRRALESLELKVRLTKFLPHQGVSNFFPFFESKVVVKKNYIYIQKSWWKREIYCEVFMLKVDLWGIISQK